LQISLRFSKNSAKIKLNVGNQSLNQDEDAVAGTALHGLQQQSHNHIELAVTLHGLQQQSQNYIELAVTLHGL